MALELQTPDGIWTLKEPVPVHLRRRDDSLELNCPPVQLARTGASLLAHASVQWPSSGSLRLDVQGLRAEDFDDFLKQSLPRFSVSNLAAAVAWDNGPLTFEIRTLAGWMTDDGSVWTLNGDASADGDALRFESVRLRSNGSDAAELAGDVPLRIEPGRGWAVSQSPKSGPAHLDLRVSEAGPLWRILETYAGVQVESPSLTLEAHGAAPDLEGRLTFGAAHIALTRTNAGRTFVIPQLDYPELQASVDGNGIEIRQASALLLGQRVEANARWAFTAPDWKERIESLLAPDWRQLSGSLRLEQADLSALSSLAPGLLAPIGRMGLEVELKPGLQVQGRLTLTNAATRYLKPVGALRDINADLTLRGREARVNRFEAMLGGRPTVVSGSLGWRSDGDRRLDLHLTGGNLSLVRDPDLFLRADLDLHLSKSFGEVSRLTGEVGLQRSLLFRDFNALIGFDREQPQQRPPYFSIPQPPFGDWQLDVRVKATGS